MNLRKKSRRVAGESRSRVERWRPARLAAGSDDMTRTSTGRMTKADSLRVLSDADVDALLEADDAE